jgi:hypothetical protein
MKERWKCNPRLAKNDSISIAYIRRSFTKDAINATALAEVVKSLKNRNIPIKCYVISEGNPRRFYWNHNDRVFVPGNIIKSNNDSPVITLLGPSDRLVKKHSVKLPYGHYVAQLAFLKIPIKRITVSNQLSYILKIEFDKQGILITGDAGGVDFLRKKIYYEKLLEVIHPLHIIQVAHHAGNNHNFYPFLLASGYPKKDVKSFLLISHATKDKSRPSEEFRLFIEEMRNVNDNVNLLFTSKPEEQKVKSYQSIIFKNVGSVADVGDVQICYNKKKWEVIKHSIKI